MRGVRRFLGMANQLSKFIPNLLRDLPQDEPVDMGPTQKEAFMAVKEALTKISIELCFSFVLSIHRQ